MVFKLLYHFIHQLDIIFYKLTLRSIKFSFILKFPDDAVDNGNQKADAPRNHPVREGQGCCAEYRLHKGQIDHAHQHENGAQYGQYQIGIGKELDLKESPGLRLTFKHMDQLGENQSDQSTGSGVGQAFAEHIDQQEAGLDEGRLLGDLLDRVPAVTQDAGVTVDVGDRAGAARGVGEAAVEGDIAGLLEEGGDVVAVVALGGRHELEVQLLARCGKLGTGGVGHASRPSRPVGPGPLAMSGTTAGHSRATLPARPGLT